MGTIASQITSFTIVYWTVYSDADQRKHQSCASLAFVRGIRWGPMNFRHKWPVTRKIFPIDDVIMCIGLGYNSSVFMSFDKKLMAKWAAAFIEPIKLLWYKVEHDLIGFTQVKCLRFLLLINACEIRTKYPQKMWDEIIHPNPKFNDNNDKQSLGLRHGWVIKQMNRQRYNYFWKASYHLLLLINFHGRWDGFMTDLFCHYDPRCTNPT